LPPLEKASSFEVYLGNSCKTAKGCQKAYGVEGVMSGLKDLCDLIDDIAILELDEYVSSDEAVPICLPSEHQQLVDPLQSAGAGSDENRKLGYLQTLKYIGHREDGKRVTVLSNRSSVCNEESNLHYAKLCRILFREIVVVRSFKEDQTADLQLLEFCQHSIIGNSRERRILLAK
uniref:SNF2_N domain-containing protein n=1 Tax=Heligmosomoides polygyrus TaxID=6339 RepID=A0A183GV56_HELPZ